MTFPFAVSPKRSCLSCYRRATFSSLQFLGHSNIVLPYFQQATDTA